MRKRRGKRRREEGAGNVWPGDRREGHGTLLKRMKRERSSFGGGYPMMNNATQVFAQWAWATEEQEEMGDFGLVTVRFFGNQNTLEELGEVESVEMVKGQLLRLQSSLLLANVVLLIFDEERRAYGRIYDGDESLPEGVRPGIIDPKDFNLTKTIVGFITLMGIIFGTIWAIKYL